MMRRYLLTPLLLVTIVAASANAHEVHHSIETGGAVIVLLKYADGKPFAFEAFEATPDGSEVPTQVGRTDANGRAIFLSDEHKHWKLKAYSADGHGVSFDFDAPAVTETNITAESSKPNRASILLFGLSALLGIFGLYQLFIRRSKS